MFKILPTPAPWQMNFRIAYHQSNFLGNAPMWISNTSLNCSAALKPIALFGRCKEAAVKNDKEQPRQTCRSRYLYDPYGQNSPGCYGLDGTNTTYNDVSTRRSKHTKCMKLQSQQMSNTLDTLYAMTRQPSEIRVILTLKWFQVCTYGPS